ncbi:MAG TPA: nucleotidyl transferase AbiEii/AbiGii toxin family protein [Solirubrobacterales bacterium]|nr:nucleotidyl transferase AbiEii/AbiGii toxin family protein [Solirubrobacterales bacterium]
MAKRETGSISLPDKVTAIHRALTKAKVPHAIGGALALAYYAEPRTTIDVDVNVFVPTERWPAVRDALEPLGVDVDLDEVELERDGQVRLRWDRNPIDLFFSYDPFHDEMRKSSRRVPFADETIPILSPEHLAVCKAMFDRPKDWIDIEQILVATDPLDLQEIESWLERMVGSDDPRMMKLGEVKAALSLD